MSDIIDQEDLQMPIPCEQENNIQEIKALVHGLTTEFRLLLGEMREAFIEDREHKIKIQNLEKGQEIIFEKIRIAGAERKKCIEQKIDPLVKWRDNLDGSLSTLKAIPIACVVITTLMAVYTFTQPDIPAPFPSGLDHTHKSSTIHKSKVGVD